MTIIIRMCLLLTVTIFAGNLLASVQCFPAKIDFRVYSSNKDNLFYTGQEEITVKDNIITKTTSYYLEKQIVQQEKAQYKKNDLQPLAFNFENKKTGKKIDMKKIKNNYKIYFNSDNEPDTIPTLTSDQLTHIPNLILDKSLNELICKTWENLKKQGSITVPILIAHKAQIIKFTLSLERQQDLFRLQISPASFWLSLLIPKLMFFYKEISQNHPKLVRYQGPSSITLPPGGEDEILMEFNYSGIDK